MSYIFGQGYTRPSRLDKDKGKEYHKDFAKHCLGEMSNISYRKFIDKSVVNWSFFKGGDGQWIFDEDVESFFLDESGDIRNRLKWTKNVIKPMVQQYVGNAIRLSFNARAECISDFVINEREKKLTELKYYHDAADSLPFFSGIIKEKAMLKDTYVESVESFYNMFVEEYEEDINNLVQYIAEDINIDDIKVNLSRDLAISGICIYKGFEENEVYKGENINPLFFFWDMSAKRSDLTDAEFMGEWYYQDAPSLFERYDHLTRDEMKAIENYGRINNSVIHKVMNGLYTQNGGKVPVYEVYWKDMSTVEYGWVKDDFGYPFYTLINHEDSNYTDKDLIEPQTDEHKEDMGKKKKHKVVRDELRYCILIPHEEVGSLSGDIILEYGLVKYEERKISDPSNVKFPYKVGTWVYDRGEVLTPLDDVIDPQRFLNRTISVIESHMSNMRGTGTVISKSAVDARDGEADMLRNMNQSKPIFVDTDRVGSVQNAVGTYGSTVGNGTLQLFQVVNEVQRSIQDVTGVNEAMTGTQGGSDALVGVIEAQIQRGSLVQEPFYYQLTKVLGQAYEQMATLGKAIYYDNPRRLAMMVGDKGMANIKITENHLLQDYRMFINRVEDRKQEENNGNTLLFTFLQSGLIDKEVFANLFNRATPDRIAKALRRSVRVEAEAQATVDKAQVAGEQMGLQNEEQMAQAMNTAVNQQGEMDALNKQAEQERELEKIAFRQQVKNQQ
jgi:hypothetical protein